jgi:hypothetical protein
VLFKSVVRCLLSTGEPALRSLHDIWYVILNDKKDVCDTFNSFFINVANDIGKGIIFDENNHPSIDRIRKNAFVQRYNLCFF